MQTLKTQAMKSIFTMRKCRYQKFGESFFMGWKKEFALKTQLTVRSLK